MMETFDLLIKNGMVYSEDRFLRLNIGVNGEKIAALLDPDTPVAGRQELDATNRYVLPGFVDFHAHIREPGPMSYKEDWETGTKAAANSGITAVCIAPNHLPRGLSDSAAYDEVAAVAGQKAVVDFHLVASPLGYADEDFEELGKRSAFYKLRIMDTDNPLMKPLSSADPMVWDECFAAIAKQGKYCGIHTEDVRYHQRVLEKIKQDTNATTVKTVMPQMYGDAEMSACAWHLAYYIRKNNMRWHALHCWHSGYIDLVRMLKKEGADIIASVEILPTNCMPIDPNTVYTEELVDPKTGLRVQLGHCAPPDWSKVWDAVRDGTIDILSSDHSAHGVEDYRPNEPFRSAMGIPGWDWYGHLLLNEVNKGTLTLEQLVKVTSENGCKAFGWYDRKGSNNPGTDADFTICDMDRVWTIGQETIYTKSGLCPYYGLTIKGKVTQTIVRGTVIMNEGEILVEPGYGRYIEA